MFIIANAKTNSFINVYNYKVTQQYLTVHLVNNLVFKLESVIIIIIKRNVFQPL